jgi:hypothetical protein
MNEPRIKEKKQSKLEKLKWYNDRMDRYMKVSLNKITMKKSLMRFVFFSFFNLKSPLEAFHANLIFTPQVLCFKFVRGLKEPNC